MIIPSDEFVQPEYGTLVDIKLRRLGCNWLGKR